MAGSETNLGELLLTAAQATPGCVCLETEEASYTFEQVFLMVSGVRRALRKALSAVSWPHTDGDLRAHERRADEQVVTIVLERGVEMLVSIHAVMLERCCYNAFDVAEPVEKLQSWVEVCNPAVIISTKCLFIHLRLGILSTSGHFKGSILDIDWALQRRQKPVPPQQDQEDTQSEEIQVTSVLSSEHL